MIIARTYVAASPDPFEPLRVEARSRWKTATPYRLGYLVGEKGLSLVCPYDTARSLMAFRDGKQTGHRVREQHLRDHAHQQVEAARQQFRTLYRRMATECVAWHLYEGRHQETGLPMFSLFREDAVFDLPLERVLQNVHCMTEERVAIFVANRVRGFL